MGRCRAARPERRRGVIKSRTRGRGRAAEEVGPNAAAVEGAMLHVTAAVHRSSRGCRSRRADHAPAKCAGLQVTNARTHRRWRGLRRPCRKEAWTTAISGCTAVRKSGRPRASVVADADEGLALRVHRRWREPAPTLPRTHRLYRCAQRLTATKKKNTRQPYTLLGQVGPSRGGGRG